MIKIGPVEFSFQDDIIYTIPSWSAQSGDLIYLSGPNGAGKSSYLKGLIHSLEHISLSYFSHNLPHDPSLSLGFTSQMCQFFQSHVGLRSPLPISYAGLKVSALSAGQQRLCWLKAILNPHSALWIIDEGWIHLDTESVMCTRENIQNYLTRGGIVLYTDHNQTLDLPITHTLNITKRIYARC